MATKREHREENKERKHAANLQVGKRGEGSAGRYGWFGLT
jgi:hypothetical protein